MRGEQPLFGDSNEPDWRHLTARHDDPISSKVTMTAMDLSAKRLTKAQFCLSFLVEHRSGTAAEIAFEVSRVGIHDFPKPNFVAHWLADCRDIGWAYRFEDRMRDRGMIHVPTEIGQHQRLPHRRELIWTLL